MNGLGISCRVHLRTCKILHACLLGLFMSVLGYVQLFTFICVKKWVGHAHAHNWCVCRCARRDGFLGLYTRDLLRKYVSVSPSPGVGGALPGYSQAVGLQHPHPAPALYSPDPSCLANLQPLAPSS